MCFNNVGAAGSRGSGSNFMIASIKINSTIPDFIGMDMSGAISAIP